MNTEAAFALDTAAAIDDRWETVCDARDIPPNIGVRALINGGQVALFRVAGQYYGIDAIDPFSGAAVLARGIVGDLKGQIVVASPVYKQHFNLATGQCLEDEQVRVRAYRVREVQGRIQVGA